MPCQGEKQPPLDRKPGQAGQRRSQQGVREESDHEAGQDESREPERRGKPLRVAAGEFECELVSEESPVRMARVEELDPRRRRLPEGSLDPLSLIHI